MRARNPHRRLRHAAALLGGAPLLLLLGDGPFGLVPVAALALGLVGALMALSALDPGGRPRGPG